jgi:hypothetical protein
VLPPEPSMTSLYVPQAIDALLQEAGN